MLSYLVILLDDSSTSFCNYENRKQPRLIDLETLNAGIIFGMKENLAIQFVYPDYELPTEYMSLIDTIDHSNISSIRNHSVYSSDLLVFNDFRDFICLQLNDSPKPAYVVRIGKKDFFENCQSLLKNINFVSRLNIIITDVETFNDADFKLYAEILDKMVESVFESYNSGHNPQINILTDRLLLDKANNCNAGVDSITLAPNGRFYVCPAFYFEDEDNNCGDVVNGLNIKNKQLLRIDHAPICRICDAYHCKRCVFLNQKMTWDINTPSHEQCVVSHIERNASRKLLVKLEENGLIVPTKEIKEIIYLDPFDLINTKDF